MPDPDDKLNYRTLFTWNYGVPRWLSFGVLGRIAWLAKDRETPVTGTWHQVAGRLYVSDKRPWVAALKSLDGAAIANPE
jgi:hypothetical protein